jgi:hypothetical protein
MNGYKKQLESEYGKDGAARYIKAVRPLVKASRKPMSNWKLTDDMSFLHELHKGTDGFRPYALAMVALLRDSFGGQVTANLDDFLGYGLAREWFNCLRDSYDIMVFAVAQPYQIAFTR